MSLVFSAADVARTCHPRPFAEIGRVPHRDRFTSASRSVQFRVEIGSIAHCANLSAHRSRAGTGPPQHPARNHHGTARIAEPC
ncbi:MAG: hypothetical protein DI576_16925 [Actinomyces sp.]|nr:MAG: hypothetical protein DI576_16925 [Actinomyces sp.]